MNDHVAKPIDKERLVLCLLGHHLGRSGARGAQRQRTRANWSSARGDIVGRFGGSLELIVEVLRRARSGYAGPLRPARTPARRGRCPGQRRDPAYHQGQRFHRWRQRHGRGRASELEQALRRADPLRGMEILAGIRLDELRTLCDAACSACRRCSATCRRSRRAELGAVASPAKDSGGPGLACIRAACRANNAMGVIRRYS